MVWASEAVRWWRAVNSQRERWVSSRKSGSWGMGGCSFLGAQQLKGSAAHGRRGAGAQRCEGAELTGRPGA
ncbi:hypothetical protein GCM10018790_47540 [Kitasatospora xanthocidica]|nr:hypothetical protein GCM10018790_47540 [Kitasatospora xanthocidica]